MRRVVDGFLILAILTGGFLAWQSGRERNRLQTTYAHLAHITGDMAVSDPSMVYVQALDTGEPLHFAWRVYCPPGYKQNWKSGSGGNLSTSWATSPSEFIARVRIRQEKSGLAVYTHFGGGSSKFGIGSPALDALLRNHRNAIRVEQLGAPKLTAIAPDKPAVLLRLRLPDDLLAEAREKLSPNELKEFVPEFFELDLGPNPTATPTPSSIPKP